MPAGDPGESSLCDTIPTLKDEKIRETQASAERERERESGKDRRDVSRRTPGTFFFGRHVEQHDASCILKQEEKEEE